MLREVVFDFDGTVADSERLCFELFNELAAKHGCTVVDEAEWNELKRQPYPERLRRLGVSLLRVPFLAAQARHRYRDRLPSVRPFEGVADALTRLKEGGCSLHVLSSNSEANITRFLGIHGIRVFDSVRCERNFFGKHVALRRFLQRRGLAPGEMLYVGDELRDIEACRKVGIPIISAGWGFDPPELLEAANPGLTARTPADAVRLVQTWVARSRPAEGEDAVGWALAAP